MSTWANNSQNHNNTTLCNSILPSFLSFSGVLVWSYFFLWLLHSFWESWSNQTPWVILLIPTSTRITADQAEKSIKASLMVFVYERDAERRAHALLCELSPSLFQKTRLLLSGVPQKGCGEIVEQKREWGREGGDTERQKKEMRLDGQISLDQRKKKYRGV